MVKIIIHKEPIFDDDILNDYFTIDADFTSDNDSTTNDLVKMFVQAIKLDGYHEISIIKSMKDYVDNYLDNDEER